ncbi:MAG: hypothetical protein WCS34_07700 [Bacteroidales bacterium]
MKKFQLFFLFLLCISVNLNAKRIYVRSNIEGNGNGTSWESAFSNLQDAIKKSKPGDEIWVAKGTYYPTDGTDKSISFKLKEKISLFGGFTGTETSLSQRDWIKNLTILSGNIGDKSINTDNSMHVVVTANGAVIDGFIVEDGYAMGTRGNMKPKMGRSSSSQQVRNGVGAQRGSQRGLQRGSQRGAQNGAQPQTHTTPQNILRSADNAGAGILNFKTYATIRNTTIRNCYASKGGGIYNMTNTSSKLEGNTPSPVFIYVKIEGNYAEGRGGGMQNDMGTNPILINCEFTNNECSAKGGALYNDFGCSPILINCFFEKNTAHDAAAIGNDGSSCPIIVNSKIINNTVESEGAGLYQGSYNANVRGKGNNPLVINSVIKNNKSKTNGSANITLWGEDWIYAWKSEIEGFNHSLDTLEEKYNELIEISTKIKSLSAEQIDKLYSAKLKTFINSPNSSKKNHGTHVGFGTDNVLTKTASIPNNIIYVKQGPKEGDGTSWGNAYNNLQDALKRAEEIGGAEIWIAEGTYKPTTDSNRNVSFVMKNGIAIYGGFSGNEKNKTERNIKENKTILSGNIGDSNSKLDNSFHVLKGSINSIIDGLTISDGYANGKLTNRYGGGLYNWSYDSSSIIRNSTFSNNYAEDAGAVFCFADVLSYFENVNFENNSSLVGGAASFRFGASCELSNCTFKGNVATSRGGAITINYGSNVILNNSTFTQNSTQGNGLLFGSMIKLRSMVALNQSLQNVYF